MYWNDVSTFIKDHPKIIVTNPDELDSRGNMDMFKNACIKMQHNSQEFHKDDDNCEEEVLGVCSSPNSNLELPTDKIKRFSLNSIGSDQSKGSEYWIKKVYGRSSTNGENQVETKVSKFNLAKSQIIEKDENKKDEKSDSDDDYSFD